MKAYRITHILFTEDHVEPYDVERMGKEQSRFLQEEYPDQVTGGYLSSVTPVQASTVQPAAPEPRASRK